MGSEALEEIPGRTLELMAGAPRYHRWVVAAFRPYLRPPIIEVGCGLGAVTELLLECGPVTATDLEDNYLEAMREKFRHRGDLTVARLDLRDLAGWEDAKFATVVSVNVLEHIEDDGAALVSMYRLLVPGGHLAIQVPALPALFGPVDARLGHFRRYTKQALALKLEEAGFVIRELYYKNLLGTVGWFINARLFRRETLPRRQVLTFDRMVPVLAFAEKFLPRPFGMSVVAIAQKPL